MAVMMRKLYIALRRAGVDENEASEAAEEIANYDNRIAKVESRLDVLTWMVGFNLALSVAILFKLFH